MLYVALYLLAIVLANVLVAAFGPGMSIANAFLFIALDLTARDRLHDAWHHHGLVWKMATLIAAGSILSYWVDRAAGPIALASFVSFACANVTDTLVYHILRDRAYLVRVNGSNLASAAIDSIVFPTLAFGALLPIVILGQFAAKVAGGVLWSFVLNTRDPRRDPAIVPGDD